MKERCTEFVFENEGVVRFEEKATKGKILEISIEANGKGTMKEVSISDFTNSELTEVSAVEGEDRRDIYSELPSISAEEYAETLSVYMDNYRNKAIVPQGWVVSGVPSENVIWHKDMRLVIYYIPKEELGGIDWKNKNEVNKLMETYDQLVWNPVNRLSATSTSDGIHFNEKFGRINYRNEKFSRSEYHEPLVGELAAQKDSIDKYGGYYMTRYKVSRDKETGEPRSIKGAYPWTKIDLPTAKNVAATMAKSENLMSHLTYGAEYDTRIKWAKEIFEIGEDGFVDNMNEWTQEQYGNSYYVIRGNGGDFYFPVACRVYCKPDASYDDLGFRATICIK